MKVVAIRGSALCLLQLFRSELISLQFGFALCEMEIIVPGCLGGSAVEHLPSAQGVILESQDRVPHQALCVCGACFSLYLCLCLSHE